MKEDARAFCACARVKAALGNKTSAAASKGRHRQRNEKYGIAAAATRLAQRGVSGEHGGGARNAVVSTEHHLDGRAWSAGLAWLGRQLGGEGKRGVPTRLGYRGDIERRNGGGEHGDR